MLALAVASVAAENGFALIRIGGFDRVQEHQRRAGGRVELAVMVRFDNFHVKGIAKDACRLLGEGTQQGNAEAHVAGAENRHDFRRFGDLMKLLVGQTRRGNDDRDAVLRGVIQHVRAGLPVGEINHHIRLGGVGIVRIEGEIRLIWGDPGGNVHAAHHVNAGGFCLRGDLAAHEAARAADEDGHRCSLLLVFPKKMRFFVAGISLLRERPEGFAIALWTASRAHLSFLIYSVT